MKHLLKLFFAGMLALFARIVIKKYKPFVIMVTGSVGKTSTKDAIACALGEAFYLRQSEKSYNTEFGVPLTILGVTNPWKNPFSWAYVFKEALALAILPNHYPNLLALEVGADRPGDLAKILRIVTPDAVVVTPLPDVPVHVEAYPTPQAVREEEFAPAYALAPGAVLIISADDSYAKDMALRLPVRVLTYGVAEDAHVRIFGMEYTEEGKRIMGMSAHLQAGEEIEHLSMSGVLGRQQLLSGAAAVAVSLALQTPLHESLNALASFTPPPGRMRLLSGKNDSTLIDDSYNASPVATEVALDTLKNIPHKKRTVAILGDMLELGRYSVLEHEKIGKRAADSADFIITVGIRARGIAEAARASGVPDARILSFNNSHEAAEALPALIEAGDIILVKGSQSIRMERIVEALLANPVDASKLIRQEKEWKRRP